MDAVKFLNEYNRLCNTYLHTNISDTCEGCPLWTNHISCSLDECKGEEVDTIVSAVEQWSKENPVKTYKDGFLEKFPNAELYSSGVPKCCRNQVYGLAGCESGRCSDCWNMEMEL